MSRRPGERRAIGPFVRRLLVLLWAVLAPTAAWASWWSHLPHPPGTVLAIGVHPTGPIVLTREGEIHRWDGRTWTLLGVPHEMADTLAVTSDRVYVWADGRPFVREFSPIGTAASGPGGTPAPPGAPLVALVEDPRGTTWAVDARGTLRARDARGWAEVVLPTMTGSVRPSLVAHPDGGVWVVRHDTLHRVTRDRAVVSRAVAPGTIVWSVDEEGRPILGVGPTLYTEAPTRPLTTAPWTMAAWDGRQTWLSDGARVWALGGAEPAVAAPGAVSSLTSGPGRPLFALDGAGGVVELRPGPGPALSDVTEAWGAMQVGDAHPVVADTDGDGLDDLVSLSDRGRLRYFLQRDGALVDGSRALSAVGERVGAVTACDLDRNGAADLVVLEPDAEPRLRFLRSARGNFVDATDRSGLGAATGSALGFGPLVCTDLDADGDLDLVLLPGDAPVPVQAWQNTGWGLLEPIPLAARGLGAPEGHAQAILIDDFDGNGIPDALLGGVGGSPRLVLGVVGGPPIDHSLDSGLGSWLPPLDLWRGRLPGADVGLLTLDPAVGPRAWRGSDGAPRFVEITQQIRLEAIPPLTPDAGDPSWAVADLDEDGTVDVVTCHPTRGCTVSMAHGATYVDVRSALPRALTDVHAVASLDLGDDGDADLVLLRPGQDALWENHHDRVRAAAPVPTEAEPPLLQVQRGLAWAKAWPDGLLAAASVLPGVIAYVLLTLQGTALLLGRRLGAGALVTLSGLGWLLLLESPVRDRVLVALFTAAVSIVGTFAEIRYDRNRRARRVAGYRLGDKIGQGGMGTVYTATHEGTGQVVALKIVHPDMLARAEDRQSYAREAQIGAQLRDPRIVRILETGETTLFEGQPQRTAYLVMELLHGQTLRAYLNQNHTLAVEAACTIVREVALALATLHEAGIVHRDVKPDNVMLLPDGSVKLMDLGAARQAGHVTKSKRQVLGTLGYLAPEQGRGRAPDPRSDVYACGIVLYEMLAGHRPFEADDLVALLQMVLQSRPPRLQRGDVPQSVRDTIDRALAKDPDHRFPSAQALADALTPWANAFEVIVADAPEIEAPNPALVRGEPVAPWSVGVAYARAAWRVRGVPSLQQVLEMLIRHGWQTMERPDHRRQLADALGGWSRRLRADRPLDSHVASGPPTPAEPPARTNP